MHVPQAPHMPPTPTQKSTKNASKIRPPKKRQNGSKSGPQGGQHSAQNRLKSAFGRFLGPGTSKMRLREGLQKQNRFLSHSGTLKSGPNLINSSKKQGSRGPQKNQFWAPFWDLFGSPSLHYTPSGGPWGPFWRKKEGPKNTSFFRYALFRRHGRKRLPK